MSYRDVRRMLSDEAEEAEQSRDESVGPMYRRARPSREPAQVYSVRMPVERLEQLRLAAKRVGMTPSALMRKWILERLDNEIQGTSGGRRSLGLHTTDLDVRVLLLTEPSEWGKDVWSREWSRVTSLLDHWIRDIKGPDVEDAAKTG